MTDAIDVGVHNVEQYRARIVAFFKRGMNAPKITELLGLPTSSERMVHRKIQEYERERKAALAALANPEVFADVLDVPAKKKIAAVIEQHKKKLNEEFAARVEKLSDEKYRKAIDDIYLPHIRKRVERAEAFLNGRGTIVSREEYKKILVCLHPDRQPEEFRPHYEEAMKIFSRFEPPESTSTRNTLPATAADLVARKAKRAA